MALCRRRFLRRCALSTVDCDIDSVNKQRVLRAKIAGKSEEEIYKIESDGREQRLAEMK